MVLIVLEITSEDKNCHDGSDYSHVKDGNNNQILSYGAWAEVVGIVGVISSSAAAH